MLLHWFTRQSLGRRIVALMILGNVLLSCVATGIQLFIAYDRGRDEVLDTLSVIENSFQDSLSAALWKFDFQQAEIVIDGIFAKSDLQFLKLESTTGQVWQRGEPDTTADIEHVLPIAFVVGDGSVKPVGSLTVGLTFQNLHARLWNQLATLVASNLVKTLIASMIMLLIFDRLVARHLRHMSQQLASGFMLQDQPDLRLDSKQSDATDELQEIATALNHAKAQVSTAHIEMSRINADLQDANREQAEFTYAISHDLKSPMNTLQMLLDELENEDKSTMTEDAVELLSDARLTAVRMRRLIDDVLDYARTIGASSEFATVDLAALIDDVLLDLNGDITKTGARISIGQLPRIQGSPVQMRMLFQNLISNAVKFTQPGQAPEITVGGSVSKDKDQIEIFVSDQGIGIPVEYQQQVFGMFQKLHSEKTYPGSGLGLTLCNRVVSNHSGSLSVSSSPGDGTTFRITLPLGKA